MSRLNNQKKKIKNMNYHKDSVIRAQRFMKFQAIYKNKTKSEFHLPSDVCNIVNEYAKPFGIRLDWRTQPTPSCLAISRSHKWQNFSKKYLKQKTRHFYRLIMHEFNNLHPGEIINMWQVMRSTSSRMDGVPEWAVKEVLIASNHSSQDPKKWIHSYKWQTFWD